VRRFGLYLAVERLLDIKIIAAVLFGAASYGLLGLWLHPRSWRQGIPAALLLLGALPFGEFMQVFVGYSVRILTAIVVRDGLAAAGIGAIGVDTILVFENGVSQVDLPCSGVKSLWTGALFLIAATWIERRPLGRAWVAITLVFSLSAVYRQSGPRRGADRGRAGGRLAIGCRNAPRAARRARLRDQLRRDGDAPTAAVADGGGCSVV
jgi:exosortase O